MHSAQHEFSGGWRLVRGACAIAAASALFWFVACNSDARGVDTCRTVETARCQKLAGCPGGALRGSTVESCTSFYTVQCGNGLQDGARDPSAPELTACLAAIGASCDVANDPYTAGACTVFLGAPITDAGVDAAREVAGDDVAAAEAPAPDAPTGTDSPAADAAVETHD